MKFLRMDDYNATARMYWWATAIAGLTCFAYALAQLVQSQSGVSLHLLTTLGIVCIVGAFPVQIPGTKTSLAAAEVFIFLLLLTYGVPAAVVAAAAEVAIASWRTSKRWTSRLGSPALASISMLLCGSLFHAGLDALAMPSAISGGVLLSGLVLFALGYAAVSSFLPAFLIALKRGHFVDLRDWSTTWIWLGLAYSASASVAGVLYLASTTSGPTVLFVGVPIIASLLTTLHFYFERAATKREVALTAQHLRQMQVSEARFHSAFTHAAIGMALVSSQGKILQTNEALVEMLGHDSESLHGQDLRCILAEESAQDMARDLSRLLGEELNSVQIELSFSHKAGHSVWCTTNMAFFDDSKDGTCCLIFQIQDVTARRNAERRLQYVAYHDDLTALPNRIQFNEHLRRAIDSIGEGGRGMFAVLFLDFDRFKVINDSLGHSAGDTFLTAVADRLRALVGKGGVVARLGGDEFGILLERITAERIVLELADRILVALKAPVALLDTEVSASVSIGITFGEGSDRDPEEVLRDADIAMYKAKSLGKARYALFDATLHAKISRQLQLEGELRKAVPLEQLVVYYQPKFALATGYLTGFEALARWIHPERGLVEPGLFIPLAEETGLIVPIGEWVLGEACRQLVEWERKGLPRRRLTMNVNVSGLQLSSPRFVAKVKSILSQHGLRPNQLDLEVTESILMDVEGVLPTMNELGNFGVKLSIDDFGTGYSSLSYLHSLPIDTLKIDRSFVSRLTSAGQGEEIVRSIITLGKALGKTVIAEGVETEFQLQRLRQFHCDEGQGYLFSAPLPAAAVEPLFHAESLLSSQAVMLPAR